MNKIGLSGKKSNIGPGCLLSRVIFDRSIYLVSLLNPTRELLCIATQTPPDIGLFGQKEKKYDVMRDK
jgi:hypothetical protein